MRYPKRIRLPHEAYTEPEASFHVVISCLPGEAPFRNRALGDAVWEVVLGERERTAVQLSVACLMPDHFHAIVSPGDKSIIRWMNDFKSYTTRLSRDHRTQRFLWHRSFYDRRLRDSGEFAAAVEYIARNPSTAQLVEDDASWPWLGVWVE